MERSIDDFEFLNSCELVFSEFLDEQKKNSLKLFLLNINANEFDYPQLEECLLDPLISFSLSRKIKEKYNKKAGKLSKKAREKFRNYNTNEGELGELLLYCFLESDLQAPKILSKLEIKTATNNYVNGSDGVHYLKLPNGDYQIIFGESKTWKDLSKALNAAFDSIFEFKNEVSRKTGKAKSGLPYEKGLVSDHLDKEFTEEDREFLEKIIVPVRENNFNVDDSFGVFIGFEIDIDDNLKSLRNEEFRKEIKDQIDKAVRKEFEKISKLISDKKLTGHNFYLYLMPFTNIEETRKRILKGITT